MSFDGIIFNKVTNLLKNKILNCRINKIYQSSNTDYIFNLYSHSFSTNLIISVNNNASYISLVNDINEEKLEITHFMSILYHHINNGVIEDINQINNDRVLKLSINKINELGISKNYNFYIELTGKVTNLILTKEDNTIIDCLNTFGIGSTRTIMCGVKYTPPSSKLRSIFEDDYNKDLSIKEQYDGLSINILNQINKELETSDFNDIKSEILNSNKLYVYEKDYHLIKLDNFLDKPKEFDIFDGLNYFYNNIKIPTKSNNSDLVKTVKKELNKYKNKLVKLEKELENSKEYDKYKKYGDDIFISPYNLDKNYKEIELEDYENDLKYTLKLNEKISLKDNANNYYKKYKKLKNAGTFINEQIDICSNNIEYFDSILFQLEDANNEELSQIKDELIEQKIINLPTKSKKNNKIKLNSIDVDGIKISYGKNNIQNMFLTFKVANYQDYFFHVEGYSGSHVIVHSNQLNEKIIRAASNIAAFNSRARYSSSVPVNYCQVKDVKKFPNGKPGKVIIKNYKTIYIDPKEY